MPKLTWRAKARLRAGLEPRTRGGQPGNRNRLTHGRYSRSFLARRAHNRGILRETRALIAHLTFAAKLRRAIFPLHLVEGASHRAAMDRGRIAPHLPSTSPSWVGRKLASAAMPIFGWGRPHATPRKTLHPHCNNVAHGLVRL
jgi:hypothetical protein